MTVQNATEEILDHVAPDILIITVQYGNFADTAALVASLSSADDVAGCEMAVVDNGAKNGGRGDLEALARSAPFPIHVLQPEGNLYYWGGAAHALELLSKANDRPYCWVILCNNDVVIEDRSFFRRLRSLDGSRYPIVAPSVISVETGRDQNPLLAAPAGALKRLKWRIYDVDYRIAKWMLWTHGILKRLTHPVALAFPSKPLQQTEEKIYAPHGAFVILSAAFFERGGKLDTTIPMFAEELSLAATAERLQMPVWHRPELRVLHNAHSTTGPLLTAAKYDLERRARRHYYKLIAGSGSSGLF